MLLSAAVVRNSALLFGLSLLIACGPAMDVDPADGIYDPFEQRNRKVHAFNRGVDRAIIRPAARGYTAVLPDEIEDSVGHFATNLGQPSNMTNALLQGNLEGFGLATARFLINSTLGLGGIFDVASDFNVPRYDTDFGETLYTWGVEEGAYLELFLVGPSTQRAAAGRIVDLFTNPLSYALDDPERYYPPVASAAAGLGYRGRYSDTVDSILYDSADSYAQARLIYLQNRRFKLGDAAAAPEIDPFELNTEGF